MTTEALEALCTNCGLCCKIPTTGEYCRHVKIMPDGTTRCKIYNSPNRIGTEIGDGFVCWTVMDVKYLWDDCPYNNLKIERMLRVYEEEHKEKTILEIIHEPK